MAGQPGNSRPRNMHIPLAVVPFGSSSSLFMIGVVLNLHLSKFDTPVALDMRENIYVDNVLSGCNTEDELLAYYTQPREIMSQAKFNLRSWSTNSRRLTEVTMKDKTSDSSTTVQGLQWNTSTDILSLATRQFPPINTLLPNEMYYRHHHRFLTR